MKLSIVQRCNQVPPMPHLLGLLPKLTTPSRPRSGNLSLFFPTDIQKKQPDDDCASKASSSSSSSQADIFCNDTNSSISQSLMSVPNTSEEPSPEETAASSLPAQDGKTAVYRPRMNRFPFLLTYCRDLFICSLWVTFLGPLFTKRYYLPYFWWNPWWVDSSFLKCTT